MLAQRIIDWAPVRAAFVERPNRATYAELAEEFALGIGTIGKCASEEGWPALRARYLESQLAKADASSVLLSVVRGDRTVSTGYLSLAVVTLSTLQGIVERVQDSDKADSTKAETVNTCMFAAKNLADSLRSVGIIGAAKVLDAAGKEDNGRWNPQMLQQINLQVTAIAQQAAAAAGPAAPSPGVATPVSPPAEVSCDVPAVATVS